ncbi:hypothetical protein KBZ20_14175 [Vulcanococcus limneticus Candia 3F8]|uniref:hypothetical protein n=1 Tax=Vulcanococcus limneticus TaxID=2170428 RepID=UPI0018E3EAB7|nr:hypothetical protein [Vulcanococcus limneticus]MCP9792926.1 hypothetical protein [Vulcanococcus limneticus MW73D5]MCP9894919.1 hypothetical protein [Vulcanococcus limneticus Candia 3F8]MCP9898364.1 hypothetical protein [Vulcanococcus limneticus Candia 3B3]
MDRTLGNAVEEISFAEARQGGGGDVARHVQQPDGTVHLLRSPANAAHLQRSLEQAGRGELLSHGLIDPDPADAVD